MRSNVAFLPAEPTNGVAIRSISVGLPQPDSKLLLAHRQFCAEILVARRQDRESKVRVGEVQNDCSAVRKGNGQPSRGGRRLPAFADALGKENICVEKILEEFGEEGVVVCSDQFDAVAAFKSCITKQA